MDVQEIKKKRVSFSQYSMWMKCPYSWKLNYLEGKRIYDASLNIFFGTAIHHSVQTFLQSLYTESVEKADSINVFELFKVKFEEEIQKEKSKPGSKFTYTDDEYTEFVSTKITLGCLRVDDGSKRWSQRLVRQHQQFHPEQMG